MYNLEGERMRRVALALVLLLVVSPLIFSQTENPDWYVNKPIAEVTFDGLKSVSRNELTAITDQYVGKKFTDSVFLELQRKLYALDYFEEIVPSARPAEGGEAVNLHFQVKERPTVRDVKFVGNKNLRTGELLDAVVLKSGDIVTKAKITADEEAIRNLYLEKGFPDVSVSGESVASDRENSVNVVFTITEGTQTTIREIRFSGNTFASDSTLRGVMDSKAQSIFNRGAYQESQLEKDKRAIEKYYRDRGYVDARVTDITKEFEHDAEANRTYVTLTVYINEGEQYTFGGMTFDGNSIFTDEQLADRVRLSAGDVLDMSRLEADYQRIADLYYENGYIFNTITREEVRNEDERSISYVVHIVERNRAHIESILIRGNTKTKDSVIKREIPLEVGDVFSATRIREGLQNLANLQYFSSITPETPQGSVEGLMDLIINVEEANTADIRFGVAFGGNSEFPVSGQIRWQDRNFLGRGETIGAETVFSPVNQHLAFNFKEPYLFGRRWSGALQLSVDRSKQTDMPQDILSPIFNGNEDNAVPDPYTGKYVFSSDQTSGTYDGYSAGDPFPGTPTQSDIDTYNLVTDYEYAGGDSAAIPSDNLMEYTEWNISLGGNTGYRWRTPVGQLGVGTSLKTSINYVNYDKTLYRPFDPVTRDNLGKWLFVNKWGLNASLDTRDLVYSPSNGYYLSQAVTFTGGFLLGTRHYIRTDSKAEGYLTLFDLPVFDNWNWKMVLAAQSSISFILPQFWVPQKYRDNPQPVAGTTDLLYIDGMFNARGWDRRTDGQALWYNWLELRMPLAERVIWFDQFFDAAALYKDRHDVGQLGIDNMLFSFGAGIRFVIPQFPIRLYLAKRFTVQDGNVEWGTGGLFNPNNKPGKGLDFVFSIGTELF